MAYYQESLALVHHRAFGFHADLCAPGILRLLEPLLDEKGLVVELGCGSGLLTRYLLDAGHRVLATDASPAMLELARAYVPDAERVEQLTLPADPIPEADAIVSIGHVLSYLSDQVAIEQALTAAAQAVRPGGILIMDICDLEWGRARRDIPNGGWAGDEWALVTEFSVPTPTSFIRQMAVFTLEADGSWRRSDERHENTLIDTGTIPGLLATHGISAQVSRGFGDETLPVGLNTIVGTRSAATS